jgi:hypothetical protein
MAKSRIVLPHSRAYNKTHDALKGGASVAEMEQQAEKEVVVEEDESKYVDVLSKERDEKGRGDFIREYPAKKETLEEKKEKAKEVVEKDVEGASSEQQILYAVDHVRSFLEHADVLGLDQKQKERIERVCDNVEFSLARVQEGGPNKGKVKVVLRNGKGAVAKNPDGTALVQYEGIPVDELIELLKNITENGVDTYQKMKNRIKELEEKYFFEQEREQKANYYNQLEKAKKEFRAWEKLMDENYYQQERISKLAGVLESKSQSHFKVQFDHEPPLSMDEKEKHDKRVEHEMQAIVSDHRASKNPDAKKAEAENRKLAIETLNSRKEIVLEGGETEASDTEKMAQDLAEQMKRLNKVAIVDASEQAKQMARIRADERLNELMNAGLRGDSLKEVLRDLGRFKWNERAYREFSKSIKPLRLLRRTWTIAAEEGYRQMFIREELARIQGLGKDGARDENLFVDGSKKDEHRAEMTALADRFSQGLFSVMSKEKKAETLTGTPENTRINALVKEFAESSMTDEEFEKKKQEILKDVREKYKGVLGDEALLTADNILNTAKEFRKIYEHSERMATLDVNLQIDLGVARRAIKTKANEKGFDRVVGALQKVKVGPFSAGHVFSPVFMGFLTSMAAYAGKKPAYWLIGGGATLLFGGARKGRQMTTDLAMHRGERAMGVKMDEYRDTHKRRAELEQFSYETRSAEEFKGLLEGLEAKLQGKEGAEKDAIVEQALQTLAELEERMRLSEQRSIDLITYSGETQIERSRLDLMRAQAEAIITLKGALGGQEKLDEKMKPLLETRSKELLEDISGKDKKFASLRRRRMVGAAIYGGVLGAGIGMVLQEAAQSIDANLVHSGTLENKATTWDKITDWIAERRGGADLHERAIDPDLHTFGNGALRIPEGTTLDNNNGILTLTDNETGEVLINHFKVDSATGKIILDHSTVVAEGVEFESLGKIPAATGGDVLSAADHSNIFERMQEVHRSGWLRQNTEEIDYNERRFYFANDNLGYDTNGNIDLDISKLVPGESYEGGIRPDLEQLMQDGKIKVIFTPDSEHQHSGIVLSPGPDGHVRVDGAKDAWIHDLFGKDKNGRLTHSGYLEIAIDEGNNTYRIVSTVVGNEDFAGPEITPEAPPVVTDHLIHEIRYNDDPETMPFPWMPPFFRRPPGVRLREGEESEDKPKSKPEGTTETTPETDPTSPAPVTPDNITPAIAVATGTELRETGVKVVERSKSTESGNANYGLEYPSEYRMKNGQEVAKYVIDSELLTDADRDHVETLDSADKRVAYIESVIVAKRAEYEKPANRGKIEGYINQVKESVEKILAKVAPDYVHNGPEVKSIHLVGLYEFLAQKKGLKNASEGFAQLEDGALFVNMTALEYTGEEKFEAELKRVLAEALLFPAGIFLREVLESGEEEIHSRTSNGAAEEVNVPGTTIKRRRLRGWAFNTAVASELSDEVVEDVGGDKMLLESTMGRRSEREVIDLLREQFGIDRELVWRSVMDKKAQEELVKAVEGDGQRPGFFDLLKALMDYEMAKGGVYSKSKDLIMGESLYLTRDQLAEVAKRAPVKVTKWLDDGSLGLDPEIMKKYNIRVAAAS